MATPQNLEALTEYAQSYRQIEARGDLMPTALEQNRDDQALGAAWRRAEAIPGWVLREVLRRAWGSDRDWAAIACPVTSDGRWLHGKSLNGFGATPAAALIAVADAIVAKEAR